MKIYLAGKISSKDWRATILGSPPIAPEWSAYEARFGDLRWPVLRNAINGRHDYVGPFFLTGRKADHISVHGPDSHGVGAYPDWARHRPGAYEVERAVVTALCFDAIDRADLVFAWLNDATAFGTLVEIGYARALKKQLVIAYPYEGAFGGDCSACDHGQCDEHDEERDDLWFARECGTIVYADTPLLALEQVIGPGDHTDEVMTRCGSPIERRMLAALLEKDAWSPDGSGWKSARGEHLLVQHPAPATGHNYVLDFAILGSEWKIAVECDGHNYHERTKEQARHDRSRDRALTAAGWTVLRFTGSEIHRDAGSCADEVMRIVQSFRPPVRF